MKIIISITLSFFITATFAQKIKKTYYGFGTTKIHEIFTVNANEQKNGNYKSFDEDGLLILDGTFKNGILQGPCKEYYPYTSTLGEPKLKFVGAYANGYKEGKFTTFDYLYNGESFLSDLVLRRGDRDKYLKLGTQVKLKDEYFKDGTLYRQTDYWNNGNIGSDFFVKEGPCKAFFKDGKPRLQMTLQKGSKIGNYVMYNSNSNIITTGNYSPVGKKTGLWKIAQSLIGQTIEYGKEDDAIFVRKFLFDNNGEIVDSVINTGYYPTGEKFDECYIYEFNEYGQAVISGKDSIRATYTSYYKNGKIKQQGLLKGGAGAKKKGLGNAPAVLLFKKENNDLFLDLEEMLKYSYAFGKWTKYREDGTKSEETTYSYESNKIGQTIYFDEKGNIK